MEYYDGVYISVNYKYNGRHFDDLEIGQNFTELTKHEVVVYNDCDGEMFRTTDFDELTQFIKDLKAGKYANGKEE